MAPFCLFRVTLYHSQLPHTQRISAKICGTADPPCTLLQEVALQNSALSQGAAGHVDGILAREVAEMELAVFMEVFKAPRQVILPGYLPLSSLATSLSVQVIRLTLHKPPIFAHIMGPRIGQCGQE